MTLYLDYPNFILRYKKIWSEEDKQIIEEYAENLYWRYGEPKVTGPIPFDEDVTKMLCDHPNCSRSFRSEKALERHKSVHCLKSKKGNKFVCDWNNCDRGFCYQSALDNHVKSVHLKGFACK